MQLNPAKMARPVHADGRRYVPAIDGLRCLAAWGVISAHIGSKGASQHLVAYYGAAAYPALIVFFTISGFLVYRPFARNVLAPRPAEVAKSDRSTNFWVYLLRRVLRIFPLYWAVLGVTCIALTQFPPGGEAQDLGLHGPVEWFQAIFLIPIPDPMALLHGPLQIAMWTLAIELPFYVIVPLYSLALKALGRRFAPDADPFNVLVGGVSVLLVVIFSLGLVFGGELAFPVMSLPTGMLFAILETRQSLVRRRYRVIKVLADNWWLCIAAYVALVFLAADLALDAYATPGVTDPYDHIRNIYFPIQMTLALLLFVPVAFGRRRSLMVRFMASTPLQMLAPLTYGIYLWHVPLIRYTEEWFGAGFLGFPVLGTNGYGMPTLFIAIGLAITTFVCVELPAARLRNKVDAWSRGGAAEPAHHDPDVEVGEHDAGAMGAGIEADATLAAGAEPVPHRIDPAPSSARVRTQEPGRARPPTRSQRSAQPRRRRRPAPAAPATDGAHLATPWCEPIDGFRAVCACLAVMGHCMLASRIYPFPGFLHALGILVALFFAISAYVLYQPFLEADVRRVPSPKAATFYLRRLLRIYPLFAFALTAYLVILPEVRPDSWWGYLRLYLFLQIFGSELGEHFVGLPSAWYLCNEVIFYLLMPVMALGAAWWSNRRRLKTPGQRLKAHLAIGWWMVVMGPLWRTLLFALDVPAADILPLAHLEFFGFGVVIAGYAVGTRLGLQPPSLLRWIRDHVTMSYVLVLVPAAILVYIGNTWGTGLEWTAGELDDRLRFYPYLVAIVLLMTAATLGSPREPRNRWLSSWWLKPLSGLALHIYLWHQLVLGIMNRWFGGLDKVDIGSRFVTGAVLIFVALMGSIAVSRASQPFTDWPYEQYRALHGRLRGRGARPQPSRMRPARPKSLEPHPT